jgi:Zn-dependent oligopeptidase
MENWSEQKEWLDEVAYIIYREKMPDELIHKIIESRNYNEAYYTIRR